MRKLVLALSALLFMLPSLKADTVISVDWVDTVSIYGGSEILSGSFDWDVTCGSLSNIMTQQMGDMFTLSVLSEQNTAFVWNLYGAGEYTVEFITEGDSLASIGVLGDPGGNFYSQYLAVAFVNSVTTDPINTPEPPGLALASLGLMSLMGLSLLKLKH